MQPYLTISFPVVISKIEWLYPCIVNSIQIHSWSPCVLSCHFTTLISHCQRSSPWFYTQLLEIQNKVKPPLLATSLHNGLTFPCSQDGHYGEAQLKHVHVLLRANKSDGRTYSDA